MKILILLLLLTAPVFTQKTDCSFSKEKLAVRGLHLGMSKKDFESKFSPLPYRDIESTWKPGTPRYIDKARDPAFSGLRSITPEFYGDKLYSLEVRYSDGDFKDVLEFTASLSTAWQIAPTTWDRTTRLMATIRCDDLQVNADIILFAKVTLTDPRVVKQIAKDQEDEREKKVKGFKP